MEQGIVLGFLLLVLVVKGGTVVWVSQLQRALKAAEEEDEGLQKRLEAVEATRLRLEQEERALARDSKFLKGDTDLLCMEIRKLGAEPIPEDELDAIDAARHALGEEASALLPGGLVEEAESALCAGVSVTEGEPADEPEGELADPVDDVKPAEPGRFRILVVDDNEDLRKILQQLLSRDYEVIDAVDGYDALTKMIKEKQVFDLLITDLKMPNVNGITLLENLPQDIPTIVISGFLDKDEYRKPLGRMRPVAVFEKPFKLTSLRQAIETALQK